MGITKADLDAQRAMLARGEAKRRAAKQAEERERLRDTFAAAALTGLLSNVQRYQNGPLTEQAFEIAEFMLRERSRAGQKIAKFDSLCAACPERESTNHDAAPAARAEDWLKEPTGHATGEPGGEPEGKIGTGKQPAPPSVETDGFSSGSRTGPIIQPPERESPRRECGESSLRDVSQPDNGRAAGGPEPSYAIDGVDRPVSYAETDEKRVFYDTKRDTTEPRNGAPGHQPCQDLLQKNLTLTDAERDAVKWCRDNITAMAHPSSAFAYIHAATLRALLERLK